MLRSVLALVVSLISTAGHGQVLNSQLKSADKLIEDYLLVADEMSVEFCVQVTGNMSTVSEGKPAPALVDVRGFSAKSTKQKASYYGLGMLSLVNPRSCGHVWDEALQLEDVRYDKRGCGDAPYAPNARKNKDGDPIDPVFPMIDPFGLVLCTEGALVGNRSNLAGIQTQFLAHKLQSTELLKTGDTLGIWETRGGRGIVTVVFGRKANDYPIETRYALYETGTKTPKFYSKTTVAWSKYARDMLVPKKIVMKDTRPDGDRVENEFTLRWLPLEKWQSSGFQFSSLDTKGRSQWQIPFLNIFNQLDAQE